MPKKLVIPRSSLPPANQDVLGYSIRFRITSEDFNRFSYWSPIFSIEIPEPELISGEISISGNVVFIVWESLGEKLSYDIFVKFDNEEYLYHGTSSNTNYQLLNEGEDSIQIAVQVETSQKQRNEFFTIYESDVIDL